MITPRVLKGFRDFLPEAESQRQRLSATLATTFGLFGFVPIDTPILEYAEILLGKSGGETEKQVYHFKDNGGREVAMRFDLTVPFARFMAEHSHELYLPFKRYHIAKVWRGENTQRGRYREFVQADFDTVGVDSAAADFEIIALIRQAMIDLGTPDSKILINNRGIFNRFLASIGLAAKSVEILRTVDKLAKLGRDETSRQLAELSDGRTAGLILDFIAAGTSFNDTLDNLTRLCGGDNPDCDRLREIQSMAEAYALGDSMVLAPWITRGLDYYTGVVFETMLDAIPDIGSVCSGGRYNDLAGLYTKQRLPGVGAAIGLDRLVAALEAIDRLKPVGNPAIVLILNLDADQQAEYQGLAARLRQAGQACEVFSDTRKMAQQYGYAEKKGIEWVVFRNESDKANGTWKLKNLRTQAIEELAGAESVVASCRNLAAG
ncbi:MAG: histidine--tRNA ligase [Spirochaetes bacterium GWD1_61_31]|nr:MAG: histidine--tRNA ligase [Spirochaetes bacterium GWB1_60_80]OHD29681.1 MAG: histidine--tRNA ligase [Spirochaetes bacterium GWC1_61_12]OHD37558.1 MAG: histidine--tRNA ligase [Spirochaetes bacterium GWD1_61_31]OHD42019.1 MAG: histidine--tRNA ligase [Spirochaetes bacterium GWE1_60_18]OHD61870.1 MAG: histidine--tRNA ligase [Spirochaetes bacterium GWF1_60_12]